MTLSLSLATLGGELRHALEPERIELEAQIVLEEVFAHDAVAIGEPHQAAFVANETLVDVMELRDQRVDACLVQPQQFHHADDLVLQFLAPALLRRRERPPVEPELNLLVLHPAQPLVRASDGIEGLDDLGFELGLNCGDGQPILHIIIVVEVALADRRVGCHPLGVDAFAA